MRVAEAPTTDPLSDAVDELGLERAVYQRARLRPRAPLRFTGGGQGLHAVVRGQAWLRVGGERTWLGPGELVLSLRGVDHELHAAGGEAELVCGRFELRAHDHPMLASLPGVLHDRPAPDGRYRYHLEALLAEVRDPRAGTDAIVARLSEVLVIEALRAHAARAAECPRDGWFRGLRDPALGRVLARFHADVGARWTVASMARLAGQSRSAFATRFAAIMGEPPLTFVARWRMFHARHRLRTSDASLDEIAGQVGYASAAAFSVAFARAHGQSPGAYRAAGRLTPRRGASSRPPGRPRR